MGAYFFSFEVCLTWMNFADWCRMISKQTAVISLKLEPQIKFQYSGHLGEYKCISSKKTNACNAKFVELWADENWGKFVVESVIFEIANTELSIHYATFIGIR